MYKIMFAALTFFIITGCKKKSINESTIIAYAFRMKPGEDLKSGIEKVVHENNIKAGWISACVGSLTDYTIRFANQSDSATGSGHFEIVSLVGTIGTGGSHIHISISDSTGKTTGGHLMTGNKIYTTAEIVILATNKYEFIREKDGTTAWEELQIKEK